MGEMALGYGSEFLLLRYLGRHRAELDKRILAVTGGEEILWSDFPFDPATSHGDAELKGLNFLPSDHRLKEPWAEYWPQRGNQQNWDAVAQIRWRDRREWLLIEAKANTEEIISSCGAKDAGSLALIRGALSSTKGTLGVHPDRDWLAPYYQYANRLAALDFLNRNGEPSRLVFIYFCGDDNGKRTCPADEAGWTNALAAQDRHLGLDSASSMTDRLQKVFLPANLGISRRERLGA